MKNLNLYKALKNGQKKISLTFCILFFTSFFALGQNWENVGAPFCGNEGCGCALTMSSLAVFNGKLYAGGNASNGILSALGSWDGSQWDSLNTKFNETAFVGVNAMTEFNGDLYVGGYFPSIAGILNVNNIAKWNGSTWSVVGNGIGFEVNAMAVYNNNLYVGGIFHSGIGVSVYKIAKWNGSTWTQIGVGTNGSTINAMAVANGNVLYVGGTFDSIGGVAAHNIALWNGSNFLAFGGGIPNGSKTYYDSIDGYSLNNTVNYSINALCSYNGNLYVGGFFDSTGTCTAANIACWNGLYWSALGNGLTIPGDTSYDPVNALYEYNNVLYAGGCFTNAGSLKIHSIAQWNGSAWSGLGNGITGFNDGFEGVSPAVNAITVYNNQLYVDGGFDSAGTIQSCCLAEWDTPLAVNEISNVNSINVFPNPSNGIFTIVSTSHSVPSEEGASILEVFNVLGEKIISTNNVKWTSNLSNGSFQLSIDLSNQSPGIYLYKIINQDGTIAASGKLVKN